MKYINPHSKSGLVNKFADYILKYIDEKYISMFEVIYLGGFFVVKGFTESEKVLNTLEIRNSFVEKYQHLLSCHGLETMNIIDVIQYGYLFNTNSIDIKFYKSDNINYNQKVLDYLKTNSLLFDEEFIDYNVSIVKTVSSFGKEIKSDESYIFSLMSIKSEFPYGYSLNAGRLELFYSQYIMYQVLPLINDNELIFRFTTTKDNEDDLEIRVITESNLTESKIKSLILDLFDFNLSKFKNNFLKDFDLEYEVENQLTKRTWFVKDKSSDLILF